MTKVVVTGMGLISSIGNNVAASLAALRNGRSGIGKARFFNSQYTQTLPLAEIPVDTNSLLQQSGLSETGATRTDAVAAIALQEAINDAGLDAGVLRKESTAFISGSTVGGMCLTDEMYADANTLATHGSNFLGAYSNNAHTLLLQQHFQIGGIVNTFNTACSSAANAILFGARLLQNGLADVVIAGGVDTLSKFTVNGFNALMILSKDPCRPFDAHRKGLNLGEGAAYLVLERAQDASHKKIYAELKGWGNNSDAHHPSSTSPDGEGPYLSMLSALDTANLQPGAIDFINAHGTATENNDETESIAMQKLFDKVPAFASTKSYTGHTLAAAGGLEAVFSILNLQHQELYASLHYTEPIPGPALVPNEAYKKATLQHIMSNSFGFGGNCTSLIFSKHKQPEPSLST